MAMSQNRYDELRTLGEAATREQQDFMKSLADRSREPNGSVTFLEDTGIHKPEAIELFRKLGELNCGKFLVGRRKQRTRFLWSGIGAIDVAKAYLGMDVEISHEDKEPAHDGEEAAITASNYRHRFLLRKGLTVDVTLPLDLTKEEASRFAEFIRAIPFS
jgi:hypothetical protein